MRCIRLLSRIATSPVGRPDQTMPLAYCIAAVPRKPASDRQQVGQRTSTAGAILACMAASGFVSRSIRE